MYDNDDDAAATRVVRLLTSVYFCYRLYSSCDRSFEKWLLARKFNQSHFCPFFELDYHSRCEQPPFATTSFITITTLRSV